MEKRGPKKVNPHTKRQQRLAKSKTQNKGDKSNEDKLDTLLGDPITNTKTVQIRPKL